jgi:hypothetical protein
VPDSPAYHSVVVFDDADRNTREAALDHFKKTTELLFPYFSRDWETGVRCGSCVTNAPSACNGAELYER